MDLSRTVNVTKRVVSFVKDEVNLYDFLVQNTCELYVSMETECIEIRMPTRTENYSHYVGCIPLAVVNQPVSELRDAIRNQRHNELFAEYIDVIVWDDRFNDIVT